MTRALAIAAILLALCGVYLVYKSMTRVVPQTDLSSPAQTETRVATEKIEEETDTYLIDAEYPQFGIPEIDAKVREKIELSIAQFKKDTAQGPPPPDSAVQQYEFVSSVDAAYVASDVVSARLLTSTYMGGAHPMPIVNGLNFERSTGRELTPADALAMAGLSLEEVAAEAKTKLQATLGVDIIAPEGADPTWDNYGTFIVDGDSVAFIFQVYQVAPYVAGPQEVAFPRVQ